MLPRCAMETATEAVIAAARQGHARIVREIAQHVHNYGSGGGVLPKTLGYCLVEGTRNVHLGVVQAVLECCPAET